MLNLLFGTGWAIAATSVLIVCLLGLLAVTLAILLKFKVDYEFYRNPLYAGAALGVAWGVWTILRIAATLGGSEESRKLFQGELVSLILFWVLIPPVWFFVEYYAFDCEAIAPPPGRTREAHLEGLRTYADYSSKIWAALAALLLGVAAIVFGK